MKVIDAKTMYDGCVRAEYCVTIQTTEKDILELDKALRLIYKYEKAAAKKINNSLRLTLKDQEVNDWTMYDFDLDTINHVISIKIESGACG